MKKVYDAAIIGLGAMGSAAAWRLAQAGHSVIGFDRFGPAHDQGSSHGESRIIRQAYFESPEYVPLSLRAYELWRELEAVSGKALLHITGGLMIGSPESEVFKGSLKSAQTWDLPHQVLDANQIHKSWPVFHPQDHHCALYEERAGVLAVEDCVQSMLDQAIAGGAQLHFHTAVTHWRGGQGFTVHTEKGPYQAKRLILCPGAWSSDLLQTQLPLTVERLVLHWFQPRIHITPFLPQNLPIHIWELDSCSFYGMAALNQGRDGVKTAFHDVKTSCTPATINRIVSEREKVEMASYIQKYIPEMNGGHLCAKTCMYTSTPDAHFILGQHPQQAQAYMACGFSGHGFKFGPVIGQILAELAIKGTTQLPIDIFNPKRFS